MKPQRPGLYPPPTLRRITEGEFAGKIDMRSAEAFPRDSGYEVDVPWDYLGDWIRRHSECGATIDMNPDFQRGRVWTRAQKQAYLEFCLMGGRSGRSVFWNQPGYQRGSVEHPLVLVDGLQRMTAVLDFWEGKVKPFGHARKEWCGRGFTSDQRFRMHVNSLRSRAEVLRWYLLINAGGTPHTKKEIERVHGLLAIETEGAE